jgi:predicted  nucleic acid-binding Zn-ribbon protein
MQPDSAAEDTRRLAQLESEERTISSKRRRLHDRLDFMRSGGAVASDDYEEKLQQLIDEERELSTRRRELHIEIDALRVKLGQQPGPRERPRLLGG